MKNITCKTCGSNQFTETPNHYTCKYCQAILPKYQKNTNKRISFIVALLFIISIGLYIIYELLYSVKSDIKILSNQPSTSIGVPSQREFEKITKTNPFSDVLLRVEKELGDEIQQHTLEKALSKYHKEESNKAFFIALGSKGAYAFGMAYGAKSIKIAEQEAKDTCNKIKKLKHISDTCIPYAINNRISQFLIDTPKP